ncbi:MAG: hypothetical protein IJU68_03670 [Bacteroidales bacterium]|nr:hypothetical protein [Bacteroidales bacterium]
MERISLYDYIEHKTGESVEKIKSEDAERFQVIVTEALRDLVVMNRVAGTGYLVQIPGEILANKECARLATEIHHEIC